MYIQCQNIITQENEIILFKKILMKLLCRILIKEFTLVLKRAVLMNLTFQVEALV